MHTHAPKQKKEGKQRINHLASGISLHPSTMHPTNQSANEEAGKGKASSESIIII
jgi:hypothetical protein